MLFVQKSIIIRQFVHKLLLERRTWPIFPYKLSWKADFNTGVRLIIPYFILCNWIALFLQEGRVTTRGWLDTSSWLRTVGITRMLLTCQFYSGNEDHLNSSTIVALLFLVWRLPTENFYCIYPQQFRACFYMLLEENISNYHLMHRYEIYKIQNIFIKLIRRFQNKGFKTVSGPRWKKKT
jgi:hypothetical protein